MRQSVKLTDTIWLLQLLISSPLIMHWVTWVKPPLGFEPRCPAWEVDNLPTELSLLMLIMITFLEISWHSNF